MSMQLSVTNLQRKIASTIQPMVIFEHYYCCPEDEDEARRFIDYISQDNMRKVVEAAKSMVQYQQFGTHIVYWPHIEPQFNDPFLILVEELTRAIPIIIQDFTKGTGPITHSTYGDSRLYYGITAYLDCLHDAANDFYHNLKPVDFTEEIILKQLFYL